MEISQLAATFLVIIWLVYFSRAIMNVITKLLYWLIYKPVEQICKMLFGN